MIRALSSLQFFLALLELSLILSFSFLLCVSFSHMFALTLLGKYHHAGLYYSFRLLPDSLVLQMLDCIFFCCRAAFVRH